MSQGRRLVGTVAALWRFPTKSLRGESLRTVDVAADGLDGDRRNALEVTVPGHARSGKTLRGKEHNLLHTIGDPERARASAAERGVEVEVRNDGPYFDDKPVSVLLDGWMRDLEAMLDRSIDPLRFRANVFVEANDGFLPEARYAGAALEVGGTRLRVAGPIDRCVTPSYDVETGASDPALLRTLVQRRGNVMGVYCVVERPGSISVGDRVWVEDAP